VSNPIVQALRNEPITIYGHGQQTRSFCYVDDLITALVALMATPPDFTGPINLGNPREFSIAELAEKVVALMGLKSQIKYMHCPAMTRCSDNQISRSPAGILLGSQKWNSTMV
jgi:UDP-glucuronate decarboxylase